MSNFQSASVFLQQEFALPARSRGFHLITREIAEAIPELNQISVGLLHVFIKHTSAGLTINENADPDVRVDMETAANRICPESSPFIHTCEGPDDMPAHVKASLFGSSVTVPICDGRLTLGTWQGIYLCEHRNQGGRRRIVLTIHGSRE
ncbi:MAG: secondary thiamine-phosphate synthase enzyme [Mariniblastus sp.]|jgi:secondary thiamine-phosphate synthase enzyme